MSIRFKSTVLKLEEKSRVTSGHTVNGEAVFNSENLGWFLLLEGSWEPLYGCSNKPDFQIGDRVTVTIEKAQ